MIRDDNGLAKGCYHKFLDNYRPVIKINENKLERYVPVWWKTIKIDPDIYENANRTGPDHESFAEGGGGVDPCMHNSIMGGVDPRTTALREGGSRPTHNSITGEGK